MASAGRMSAREIAAELPGTGIVVIKLVRAKLPTEYTVERGDARFQTDAD